MDVIKQASTVFFPEVIEWLKAENERDGTGFYCNRNVIERLFFRGDGLCYMVAGRTVGFVVFQMYIDGGEIHIIEIEPSFRQQGLGSQLLMAGVEALRGKGAKYVEVECTSLEGEALCRSQLFEKYIDPVNYKNEDDNPILRRYFSEWRPSPPNPWA
ncbi:MAG: GNAT family N-acetyltransferase [Janthinobacterium svalbardensis]